MKKLLLLTKTLLAAVLLCGLQSSVVTKASNIVPVSEATTWDFSSLSFTKSTTEGQFLADGTLYVGANVDRYNNQRAVFSAKLDAAPTDLGANMLCFKPSVDGQVVLRLSCYKANISVQNITDNTAVTTFNGPTGASPTSMSNANYHGGNAYYVLATFQATANKIYSIYASTYNSNCGVFTIEFLPYANTTTALTEAASWNFMKDSNDPNYRLEEFHGITFRDFYFGTGLTWTYNSANGGSSRLLFNGNGNISTGEKTFSFKVAANTGGEIVITPSCWYSANNNTTTNMKLTDGTSDLMEFNSSHHGVETTIIIAPAATERTLTFYQTNNKASNIGIQKISWSPVTSVSGTITPAGWSTFASPYPLDLSAIEGGTTYYASAASGGTVTLSTTTAKVPAGEGIMVKGTAGETFTIPVVTADAATAISGNLLKGQTTTSNVAASTGGKYHYVFGYVTETPTTYGFYNLASDTEVAAGKAYLETTTQVSSQARSLRIVFDDITGIDQIDNGQLTIAKSMPAKRVVNGKLVIEKDGKLYNANGQQVK